MFFGLIQRNLILFSQDKDDRLADSLLVDFIVHLAGRHMLRDAVNGIDNVMDDLRGRLRSFLIKLPCTQGLVLLGSRFGPPGLLCLTSIIFTSSTDFALRLGRRGISLECLGLLEVLEESVENKSNAILLF